MLTAAEARKKVNDRKISLIRGEISLIENKINKAIDSGRTFCLINIKISDSSKKELEALGYRVTISYAVPSMGICDQTRIEW